MVRHSWDYLSLAAFFESVVCAFGLLLGRCRSKIGVSQSGGKFRSENHDLVTALLIFAARRVYKSLTAPACYPEPPSLYSDEGLLDASRWPFAHTYPSNTRPSATTLNSDTISVSLTPATMSSQPLVLKSNGNLFKGTRGPQCGVMSNTFKLRLPDKEYYHYDREYR